MIFFPERIGKVWQKTNLHDWNNLTFNQIPGDEVGTRWDRADVFAAEYEKSPLCASGNRITAKRAAELFCLLCARHANDPIRGDYNRFKMAVFAEIYQHGARWERELDLYLEALKTTKEAASVTAKQTSNRGENPSQQLPGGGDMGTPDDFVQTVNSQTVNISKRGEVETLQAIRALVAAGNPTEAFLDRFDHLFQTVFVKDHESLFFNTVFI